MTRSIAIVGAGPAGLSAAIEAVRSNCNVTLIDEATQPGGQIYRQKPAGLAAGTMPSRANWRASMRC
jgi:NADPH-dependent 2,4-dienoyl-CoA reductase/sulfur reductase-like enzyme